MSVFDTYCTNTLRISDDHDTSWVEPAAAHSPPPRPVHVLPA